MSSPGRRRAVQRGAKRGCAKRVRNPRKSGRGVVRYSRK